MAPIVYRVLRILLAKQDLVMGLFQERFGMIMLKKKKSLSKLFPVTYFWLSLELNEVLFMSWFNNARWFTFKLEIPQLSDALQEGG